MVLIRKLKGTVPLRDSCTNGHRYWQKQNATKVHLNYQLLKLQLKALSYPSIMLRAENQIILIKLKKQDPCKQQDKRSPCEVQVSTHITSYHHPQVPPTVTSDNTTCLYWGFRRYHTHTTPYNKHQLTVYIGKCPRLRLEASNLQEDSFARCGGTCL